MLKDYIREEPVRFSNGLLLMVESIVPVLILFGAINWTEVQIAGVMIALGAVSKTVSSWFTRAKVTPA
jgi:hypothetical protein